MTDDVEVQARTVFAEIVTATRTRPSCVPVARQANRWLATFAEPMRVAVAGEIKCGKSTLVNALVGAGAAVAASDVAQEQAMATGQLETTYVLTELVHGEKMPGIVVRYRDGSTTEAGLDRLHALTVRRDVADATLKQIDRVIATITAPLLERFRLIDTPGFNSVYGTDAAAALSLLTSQECDRADAVLYTIANQGLSDLSHKVATRFASGSAGVLTPMKAIGVMPRANEHWTTLLAQHALDPTTDTDPFGLARREIDQMLARGAARGLFHAVVPVAGLLAEAAALAPDSDFALLPVFHEVDAELLTQSFRFRSAAKAFTTRPDLPLDPTTRQRLTTTFSAWGLWTAIQVSRDVPSIPAQREVLDERSGVAALRELIRNHFGGRACTVRVKEAIGEVLAVNRRHRLRMPDGLPDRAVLDDVGTGLERLQGRYRAQFLHLDVLGRHYRNELMLTPAQTDDILRLTGERGGSLAARLGLPDDAAPADLRAAAVALAGRWARHAAASSGRTQRTAEDLLRSCDSLIKEVDELAVRPPGAA